MSESVQITDFTNENRQFQHIQDGGKNVKHCADTPQEKEKPRSAGGKPPKLPDDVYQQALRLLQEGCSVAVVVASLKIFPSQVNAVIVRARSAHQQTFAHDKLVVMAHELPDFFQGFCGCHPQSIISFTKGANATTVLKVLSAEQLRDISPITFQEEASYGPQ